MMKSRRPRTARWVAAIVWAAAAPSLASSLLARPTDRTTEAIKVHGLRQAVEVLRDRWGINHIYAKNEHDLFFAQGYCSARDRLFQFEMWRRQATGTVAEILGRRELKRDIGTRLHMFRGDLRQELNWYHPHGEAIVTAFVDGVNAYIDETLRHPAELPIEFKLLGIRPGKWTPAVVVSRHNGLLDNVEREVNLAQAVQIMGPTAVKALSEFYGDPPLEADPTLDLPLIDGRVLEAGRDDPVAARNRVTAEPSVGRLRGGRHGAHPKARAGYSNTLTST